MLNFIGKGSCFNVKDANNSAYYKKGNYLLLIDCGESIFKEIINGKLLEGIKEVDILITHFHSDHIGSLTSLIFYLEIMLKIKPTIITPDRKIRTILLLLGNRASSFDVVNPKRFKKYKVVAFKQVHASQLNAYGYLIYIDNKTIYYSGDCKTINKTILEMFMNNKIDYFYQDVSNYITSAHMHINDLIKIIPIDMRNKVECMHFDDESTKDIAHKNGFKV